MKKTTHRGAARRCATHSPRLERVRVDRKAIVWDTMLPQHHVERDNHFAFLSVQERCWNRPCSLECGSLSPVRRPLDKRTSVDDPALLKGIAGFAQKAPHAVDIQVRIHLKAQGNHAR